MVVVVTREGQTVQVLDTEAPLAEDCAWSGSSVFVACLLGGPCCVALIGVSGMSLAVDCPFCSALCLPSLADPSECSKAGHLLLRRPQPSSH